MKLKPRPFGGGTHNKTRRLSETLAHPTGFLQDCDDCDACGPLESDPPPQMRSGTTGFPTSIQDELPEGLIVHSPRHPRGTREHRRGASPRELAARCGQRGIDTNALDRSSTRF
jgi:hypothetical protein